MTEPTTDAVRARHAAAVEAWSWHEATDDTMAGYGFHMSQMLARLPQDSQTRDMKTSIDGLVVDLGDALNRLAAVEMLAERADRKGYDLDPVEVLDACNMPASSGGDQ